MKNITIEQLNEIISTMDLEKIKAGIEQHGYRCASKYGKLEFDLMEIIECERTTATDDYEDTFNDHSYFAEVFENVKGYEPYTFIVVTQLAIYRDRDNAEFPEHVDIYTDAPINEEYERKQSEICCCVECKGKFAKGDMIELNEKLFCIECFQKELNRATVGKPKHAKKIKDRRRK